LSSPDNIHIQIKQNTKSEIPRKGFIFEKSSKRRAKKADRKTFASILQNGVFSF
jgi:hypothetical protein